MPSNTDFSTSLSTEYSGSKSKISERQDLHYDPSDQSEDVLDVFNSSGNMAGTESPSPFIKDEPDEQSLHSPHRFINDQHAGYNMPQQSPFAPFGTSQAGEGIDPSELTMSAGPVSMQSGSFLQSYPFSSQQNLSFTMGSAGIADDELLDLGNLDDPSSNQGGFTHDHRGFSGQEKLIRGGAVQSLYPDPTHAGGLDMNQVYSNTPDGAPIQSPFIQNNFNYDQFRPVPQQSHGGNAMGTPSSYHPSSRIPPGSHGDSFDGSYMNAKSKSKAPHNLERSASVSKSPLTPRTPAMGVGALTLGTPDSGSFPSQPIHTHHLNQHRHSKSFSNQWDSTPGSGHSYIDSPISSPGQPSHHTQISDMLKTGKHASLPAKVENGHHVGTGTYQTQEAKRRRRRESHNMVERRRRDNINERIQELSHLVPQHRLEDEKVRKHLVNNSPLSPTLGATSMSPPQATSLLAGGSGRRAAGNITTGIPVEEKDKGPNKGDILNGAVGWTRDLMWALHAKLLQEVELTEYIESLGGTFPYEQTEEEKRMRAELMDAMEKNDVNTFSYSRAPGSGLRVPNFTTISGDALERNGTMSPQSLSPANQSGSGDGHGAGTASSGITIGPEAFWNDAAAEGSARGSVSFKEEDEYGMDMS